MKPILFLLCGLFYSTLAYTQDTGNLLNELQEAPASQPVKAAFKTTRVIMSHSIETVNKDNLDFRVTHRFGDFAGKSGGPNTFFGMDNSSDIRIALEYGITDRLTAGFGRNKSGPGGPTLDGHLKYRLLWQTTDNKMPFSLVLFTGSDWGIEQKPAATTDLRYGSYANRFSYVTQVIIGRKFNQVLSLEVLPSYLHRNYVADPNDDNDLFAVGISGRVKLTRRFCLVGDYYYVGGKLREYGNNNGYYMPLGLGIEVETGGHVFSINMTNSAGIIENNFLAETRSTWSRGEYRFGFNISRNFVVKRSKEAPSY